MPSRRQFLPLLLTPALSRPDASTPLIDTHIHLFDPGRFPYHPNATYKPAASPLPPYLDFVKQARIDHVVIVHPEPYQDDHSYLEYCFAQEQPRGLFKGTCLFDPIDPRTPARMEATVRKNPNRIVAMRIHAMNGPGTPPATSGPIKDRDLAHPQMKKIFAKAAGLNISVQMHFLPHHSPAIGKLAAEFPTVPVILDHMGRAGMQAPKGFDDVIALARHRNTYFKFSGVRYSSKQEHPYSDVQPFIKRAHAAFGPERILWGGLGHSMPEFVKAQEMMEQLFSFASSADRNLIRGGNAKRLWRF
jgi:predicted TIM-barrel fold metal-dependent hydrolase